MGGILPMQSLRRNPALILDIPRIEKTEKPE
jgi:hypothetical protein